MLASLVYESGGQRHPKLIRLHSTDGGLTAATTNNVLDMASEVQGAAHPISHLSIGPDGKLYVHNGDGQVTANAQNLNSYQGNILRMNLDGTPASDNPFFNAGNGTNAADYVYAYGFRNPFGGDWRALDLSHYEVENGPNTDRFARVVSGRNYLWNGSDASMTNYAIYNWGGATAPVHLQFITGNGFPPAKIDHAFVTESGATYATGLQATGKRISEFVLDASGNLVSGPIPFLEYNGSGKATAAGMIAGPDGLYNVRLTVTGTNGQSVAQKNNYITVASVVAENGGVVVFEAEEAFTNITRSAHTWTFTNAPTGFSGAGAMQALPDTGANINGAGTITTESPELQYKANFAAAGTRYVWARGYAGSGTEDSVHAGVNGAATTATNITFANALNAWVWTNRNAAGNAPTITGSAGTNTVSVWMREDNFRLDRILLTTNANFQATLGNVFHIPNNTSDLGFSMRNPLNGITPDQPVSFYTGNQFQGGGVTNGNQLQTGSTLFYRKSSDSTWSSSPMTFYTQAGNNKYYSVTLPGNLFDSGDVVQYYFKIPYDDHLPTFIYGNDSTRFNTEIEPVAQAGAFSYTIAASLQPSGPYVAITNNATGAEGRIYLNSGHIALGTNVVFIPPTAKTGSGPDTIGAVLSSTPITGGVEVRQAFGSTSIVAQLTFPYDGVMRYEVVHWGGQVINETAVTALSDAGEHFYGFGEKFNEFDQAGKKTKVTTTDPFGNKGDNSYKVAPWFMSTKGYGFHLDATTLSWFDMRASYGDRYVISNICASSYSDYVTNALKFNVVYGPKLTDVLTRYTGYTGRPTLSPPWAFAPWMSSDRWNTGGEVRYVLTKYRERGLAGSAFVFDSPWEVAYNDFTWNIGGTNQFSNGGTYEGQFYAGFANVTDMATFFRTNGWKIICWMTPFVNTSSNNEGVPGQNTGQAANYAEGAASNYFVRASVGGPPASIGWWKGTGAQIDFTNPDARKWFSNQISNLVNATKSSGHEVIGGFKTDDGEGEYIPSSAVYFDGRTGVEMKNGFAVEYHKSVWNVLGTNGILFARSGFTGSQAYPAYWAGDNEPNFGVSNGLPSVVVAGMSSAMSGFSMWSHDVGGYQNTPMSSTPENMFMRWAQFGAFTPLMQMHRKVEDNLQFPWSFGAQGLTNYQFYTRLHTALFPYIYSYAKEASTNGLPVMRPLVLLYQNDTVAQGLKHTYMFGNELLVGQIVTSNTVSRNVYLPPGKWHDYFTGTTHIGGSNIVWNNANQMQMPLFARDGAIIPMISTNVQTLVDAAYAGNPNLVTMTSALEFLIYPTTNSSFTVYDDTSLNVQSNGTVITGNLISSSRPITMRFRGGPAAGVERDGVRLTTFTNVNGFVHVTFDHTGGATQIRYGPDTDADGMPDSWEQTWGVSCAACDDDGDGLTNSQEYLAGTSPINAANFLRIATVQSGSLTFASVNGLTYRVEMTDDLAGGSWATLSNDVAGTGGFLQINDPGAASVPRRFYRVRLLP